MGCGGARLSEVAPWERSEDFLRAVTRKPEDIKVVIQFSEA
jgi:hypothetical protein